MCCTLPPLDLVRKHYAGQSISPTPAPDLFDKPRQTTSLCKWLESVFKHWHQLETLYSLLCLTRQGFPNVTNTNIDTFSLIPQRLALSQNYECGHQTAHLSYFQGLTGGVSSVKAPLPPSTAFRLFCQCTVQCQCALSGLSFSSSYNYHCHPFMLGISLTDIQWGSFSPLVALSLPAMLVCPPSLH